MKKKYVAKIQVGQLFGYWEIIKQSESSCSYFECLCTGCGLVVRKIRKWNLLKNQTNSCGCKKIDLMIKTNIQKYQCKFAQQNQKIKSKSTQTLIEKYCVDNYSRTKEFIEKCRQTSLKHWGVQHHTQSVQWQLLQKPKYGMFILGAPLKKKRKIIAQC